MKNFERGIKDYNKTLDYPDLKNSTSGLSVHLRFGTISIRHLVHFSLKYNNEGSRTWLSELIWRDFYHTILDRFPYVATGSFRPEFDRIQWPGKKKHVKLWQKGMTGYSIVDAAMRHFNATGWMHNRLRMIVASFLTKDLLIIGERVKPGSQESFWILIWPRITAVGNGALPRDAMHNLILYF